MFSCLNQTVKPHQIIIVDDCSTDRSPQILAEFGEQITVVRTPRNSGNKSSAQEYGLQFVTGEVMVTTDGDTMLDEHFVENMAREFENPKIAAVCGYIKSLKYNWITRSRAYEYSVSQNLHKIAQNHMKFLFVIPGAAGAFRTDIFKKYIKFDHDTITEDLDFTYKLHKMGFRIGYNRKAIAYTQDPTTINSYMNQMRRWHGGGWQNLIKHIDIIFHPTQALELSMLYIEGFIFAIMLFVMPFINLKFELVLLGYYFLVAFILSIFAAIIEKRVDLLLAPIPYMFLMFINAYVFLEQFVKEVIFRKRTLAWFKPQRVEI